MKKSAPQGNYTPYVEVYNRIFVLQWIVHSSL